MMASGPVHAVTVLEQCHVSPSPEPAAGQPRALPLTFFDLVFWDFPPVQRLFFYDSADLLDVPDFLLRELPLFKESLAAALHHFYPLAGKLACEMPEGGAVAVAPEVVFTDGDSVLLTAAASGDDFHDLAGDHARDTARLRPLLPTLRRHGGARPSQDVFAVQVTVFPRAGICIGTTLHHAVADGSSFVHFVRTWAAIRRLGPERRTTPPDFAPPLFDRGVVRDDAGLREAFVREHRALAAAGDKRLAVWDLSRRPGVMLATFWFTDGQLRALGRRVESETSARCSPTALACGAAWAGIERARGGAADGAAAHARFGFVTGCKPRASPPIPASYFGNCLGLCRVEAERGARREGRALRDARGWVRCAREYASERAVTVAGSPKLGVYAAADLGAPWGRPRKVEIASVERTGALAMAESGRDGDGGVEVGLALPRAEMEAFRRFYVELIDSLQ
ncbi:hypothetical protein ACP70R_011847 [Stipagrostis hirtigluma subsp. patula]